MLYPCSHCGKAVQRVTGTRNVGRHNYRGALCPGSEQPSPPVPKLMGRWGEVETGRGER